MEAKIWNKKGWLKNTEPGYLRDTFNQQLILSGFNVLNFIEHYFEPQGYTALWLLSESHFAIHTFPEKNKTYYELSSCNYQFYLKFINLLR